MGSLIRLENIVMPSMNDNLDYKGCKQINLEIFSNDTLTICGAPNTGKTTLLGILCLIHKPITGNIYYEGVNLNYQSAKTKIELQKRMVGIVFKRDHFLEELTVRDNIELPLLYDRLSRAGRSACVDKSISVAKISHLQNAFVKDLSRLQRKKVQIARALVREPHLLIVDEISHDLRASEDLEIQELLINVKNNEETALVQTSGDMSLQSGNVFHMPT